MQFLAQKILKDCFSIIQYPLPNEQMELICILQYPVSVNVFLFAQLFFHLLQRLGSQENWTECVPPDLRSSQTASQLHQLGKLNLRASQQGLKLSYHSELTQLLPVFECRNKVDSNIKLSSYFLCTFNGCNTFFVIGFTQKGSLYLLILVRSISEKICLICILQFLNIFSSESLCMREKCTHHISLKENQSKNH